MFRYNVESGGMPCTAGDQVAHGLLSHGHGCRLARLLFDALVALPLLEGRADGEPVAKLIARDLNLPPLVLALEEADQVAGGKLRIVQELEGTLRRKMTGLVLKPRGFVRIGTGHGRNGSLLAPPLQDV